MAGEDLVQEGRYRLPDDVMMELVEWYARTEEQLANTYTRQIVAHTKQVAAADHSSCCHSVGSNSRHQAAS